MSAVRAVAGCYWRNWTFGFGFDVHEGEPLSIWLAVGPLAVSLHIGTEVGAA